MDNRKKTSSDRRGEAAPRAPAPEPTPERTARSWTPDQDIYGDSGGTGVNRDLDLDGHRYATPPPKPAK